MAEEEENWINRVMVGDQVDVDRVLAGEQHASSSVNVSPSGEASVRINMSEEGNASVDIQWSEKEGGESRKVDPELRKRRMSKSKKFVDDLGYKQEKPGGLIDLSFLPKFASDEVKELNEEVLQAEKEVRDVEEAVEEQDERAVIMDDHIKRVQQEINYTQLRADTKRREVITEENLRKISEMEAARLQREIRSTDKQTDELMDRMRALKSTINKGNEKLDDFRLLMQWNQEELEQWAQAARQKDDDSTALQSYTKSDNAKLKDLYLESEKASTALYALQQKLDDEVTATQSAQIQLNRTAEVFRDLQAERQKLVSMWEETIESIHQRDEGIHKAAEEFASEKAVLREKKRQLDNLSKTLDNEIDKNYGLDRKVEMVEEDLSRMRDALKEGIKSTKDAEEELNLLKSRVGRAMSDLATEKAKKTQMQEDLSNKKEKLNAVDMKLIELQRKVDDEYSLLDTLDKKRHELERILVTEENNLKVAKKEVSDLRDKHFKETEKLNTMKSKEKDILFEIHGAKSQARSLTAQIHQLESSMIKQEEVLYSAEFQIQCLERKVARAGGETSDVETREFNAKITVLEQELQDKQSEEAVVLQQLKKSQDDRRAATRKHEDLLHRVAVVEDKNAELMLESETGLHTLKGMVREKEENMLSRDLLQMEVNRLQEILNSKADAVYGMEDTKKRLEMSMEERKREILERHEQQRLALRTLQEDLHFLLMQRNKLGVSVDKLRSKYEVILKRVKIEAGPDRSPNYFIIKAAQEREELQRQGYKLEQEVAKVQEDVSSLEKAFQDIKDTNILYRHSHKTSRTIKLESEQSSLKQTLESYFDQLRFKEAEERTILKEIEENELRLMNAENERMSAMESLQQLQKQMMNAEKENEEQGKKQRRATVRFEKLSSKLRESYGEEDAERIAKEMQLDEMRESMRDVLYKLKSIVQENPEVGERIEERVVEAGFKMPSNTSSIKSSSVSTSSRASISSRGSHLSTSARSSRSGSIITVQFSPHSQSPRTT